MSSKITCPECRGNNCVVRKESLFFTFECADCQFEAETQRKQKTWEEIGAEIGREVSKKQLAYGDSFGKAGNVLRELFPNGITPEQYDLVLTMARVLDKLFRIATNNDPYGESPWADVVGYGLLELHKREKSK